VAPLMMGMLKDHYGAEAGLQALAAVSLLTGLIFLAIVLNTSRSSSLAAEAS
jgi:hypothetical protein